jgi:hypothetical protein
MIFKDEVHPRPTTVTELCAFFLKAWATIVLSVFLRYTDSEYPFGIFKLFLTYQLDLLTELCAFFLKAWAPIPMAYINCLIQYTGDVLL